MSDDVDFMIMTRSLDRELARRGRVGRGLKRAALLVPTVLGLLLVAALLVLTGSVTLVITLSIVAMVIFELCRRGLAADTTAGGG
jgi:hypothetical protein